MTTLNKTAAEVITTTHVGTAALGRPVERSETGPARTQPFVVNAMTDITGFGLIGHLREMLLASKVSARISVAKIPILDGALDCVRSGHIPGGLKNNRDFAECVVRYDDGISDEIKSLLYDPQTAGGLLMSVTTHGYDLVSRLNAAGIPAAHIGEVLPHAKPLISVVK